MDINFYYVDPSYIEFLKQAEIKARGFTCVPNTNYSNREKFFYGTVLTKANGINYFVPISSKIKQGENTVVIKDKKNNPKGSLRFSYMIPVPRQMLIPLVIAEVKDGNRRELLNKELAFCRRNKDKINKQASKTMTSIINAASDKLKKNSCDFKTLEKAYIDFCKERGIDFCANKVNPTENKSGSSENKNNSISNKPNENKISENTPKPHKTKR